ncbi:hypothetical protein SCHPADRAFT_216894 [Schizopora paradoxa]|uniref:Secreted protein n=1 Tax=Schizopora paradoxa TaxID=27342 RepID=A0A0H2S3M0_9AGAM|nr:hypothetical protein SCHPADRAFT_216894 [Schizopora paradoxa]
MFSACFITASCIPLTSTMLTCSSERSAECSSVIRIRTRLYSRQDTGFVCIMDKERSYKGEVPASLIHRSTPMHEFNVLTKCASGFLADKQRCMHVS